MKFFGIEFTKAAKRKPAVPIGAVSVGVPGGGSFIREPFTGAWSQSKELSTRDGMLASSAVYACVDLISSDVSKLRIKYVKLTNGVWQEFTAPRYTKLMKKPNAYQTRAQFIKQWVASKLQWGNTYVLIRRDATGSPVALEVLNPKYVVPLVAPDESVYYQITMSPLQVSPLEAYTVPARDIIHDRGVCSWHPLIGMSPLTACAASVLTATNIGTNSAAFFANAARPSGVLTTPHKISDEVAGRLKAYWAEKFTGSNAGSVAVLGDDLKYQAMSMSAADSQVIEQLNFSVEDVARCFHVPLQKIGATSGSSVAKSNEINEAAYYSDCLQAHIENIECLLDDALAVPDDSGFEMDIDGLVRMDGTALIDSLTKATGAGILAIDEARAKLGYMPTTGGDTPYLQQQNYSLAALAKRDAAGPPPTAGAAPPAPAGDKPQEAPKDGSA